MTGWYGGLPTSVTHPDNYHSFTINEVRSAVRSAYRHPEVHSYGCNGFWANYCNAADICIFRAELTRRPKQSADGSIKSFLTKWLSALENGHAALTGAAVRTYLAIDAIERKRSYQPGSRLFVTWAEISRVAGIHKSTVGPALENLALNGLIDYLKGIPQGRGTASEVRRFLPVPSPTATRPRS